MGIGAEAARLAWAQKWASLSILLLASAICFATMVTVGRTAAQEQSILSAFAGTGAHIFAVEDRNGTGQITPTDIALLRNVSHVQDVIGLGPVVDVRPTALPGAKPVPAIVVGGASPGIRLGRAQMESGGAFLTPYAQAALGFTAPAGSLTTATGLEVSIMGTADVRQSPVDLARYVLLTPAPADFNFTRVVVTVERPDLVASVARQAYKILGGGDLSVVEPTELAAARQLVAGEVGEFGRHTVFQILVAGLLFGSLAVYLHTSTRRRDFGRRRAIGASRTDLIALVVASTVFAAVPGAILGTACGTALAGFTAGAAPAWEFPVAIVILVVFTFVLAAIPVAMVAAWRDPVRVLRVP